MKYSLKINFERWSTILKENTIDTIRTLLHSAIPKMPRPKCWPLAASGFDLIAHKIAQFCGMENKYYYEYRMPFLVGDAFNFPGLDSWMMLDCSSGKMDHQLRFLNELRGDFFHVNMQDVFDSARAAWKDQVASGTFSDDVENQLHWTAWAKHPSSVVVPTVTTGKFFVRSVLAICFPGLCLILKDFNSVEEIEHAWLQMPIVKTMPKQEYDDWWVELFLERKVWGRCSVFPKFSSWRQ